MAPTLILKYFDLGGVADPVRWALEQASLEWEDKRLTQEEFHDLKPSLPNGQVPVLEIDGYVLPQSLAILRYVGRLGGLFPSDDLDAAKCDAVLDSANDYAVSVWPSYFVQDKAKQQKMREDLAENFFPKWLDHLEKQLASTGGVYFGEKMTIADIMVAYRVKYLKDGILEGVPTTIADSYPNIIALHDSIIAEPKIAAFIANHAN